MKTIQQSTAINAIRNYVYFTYNFPQPDEFIRSCWAGDKVMADHLLEKLRSYNYSPLAIRNSLPHGFTNTITMLPEGRKRSAPSLKCGISQRPIIPTTSSFSAVATSTKPSEKMQECA